MTAYTSPLFGLKLSIILVEVGCSHKSQTDATSDADTGICYFLLDTISDNGHLVVIDTEKDEIINQAKLKGLKLQLLIDHTVVANSMRGTFLGEDDGYKKMFFKFHGLIEPENIKMSAFKKWVVETDLNFNYLVSSSKYKKDPLQKPDKGTGYGGFAYNSYVIPGGALAALLRAKLTPKLKDGYYRIDFETEIQGIQVSGSHDSAACVMQKGLKMDASDEAGQKKMYQRITEDYLDPVALDDFFSLMKKTNVKKIKIGSSVRFGGGRSHCDGRGFDINQTDSVVWTNSKGKKSEPSLAAKVHSTLLTSLGKIGSKKKTQFVWGPWRMTSQCGKGNLKTLNEKKSCINITSKGDFKNANSMMRQHYHHLHVNMNGRLKNDATIPAQSICLQEYAKNLKKKKIKKPDRDRLVQIGQVVSDGSCWNASNHKSKDKKATDIIRSAKLEEIK